MQQMVPDLSIAAGPGREGEVGKLPLSTTGETVRFNGYEPQGPSRGAPAPTTERGEERKREEGGREKQECKGKVWSVIKAGGMKGGGREEWKGRREQEKNSEGRRGSGKDRRGDRKGRRRERRGEREGRS